MKRLLMLGLSLGLIAAVALPAIANDDAYGDPKKVWLCHFEDNHLASEPYSDDRNGALPGFWTVNPQTTPFVVTQTFYLVGDYMVRYNAESYAGIPAGLNPGQVALCTGNGGEFILVSVNALGSDEDLRGHRAQNKQSLTTYPDGWPNQ